MRLFDINTMLCADGAAPELLMLREAGHRHANDLAHAIATLRLVEAGHGARPGVSITEAIRRLEGSVDMQRALCEIGPGPVRVAAALEGLCSAAARGQLATHRMTLSLNDADPIVDARTGWRILALVSEVLTNAAKHATAAGGVVRVEVVHARGVLKLTVSNSFDHADGDQPVPGVRRQCGSSIMDGLIDALAGSITRIKGRRTHTVVLEIPVPGPRRAPGR